MGKFIINNIWLIVISGGMVLLAVFQINTSYRIAQLERKAEELAHATLESMSVQPAGGQQEQIQTEAATPIPPTPLDTSAEVTAQPEVYLILNYREYFWARSDGTLESVPITQVEIEGNKAVVEYDYYQGVLAGEITGTTFRGTWVQSNNKSGEFELTFTPDFSSASGWWNDVKDPETHHEFGIR
ncbi:MAG: hypothetical protein JNM55_13435 [Anaerolineales bacterium]|nr:hypothetical protein [Anaerolineales bacterium]